MADVSTRRTRAFVSYSHADAEHLTRLHVHLAPYMRQGKVDVWDDTRIRPGMRWKEEIEAAIAQAKVAILLVSADFLASEFIASDEMPPLLEAAEREGTLIVSVILSPSGFLRSKLARYQALNAPSDPLIDMPRGKQEAIWAKLAEYVADALAPVASDEEVPQSGDWHLENSLEKYNHVPRRLPIYILLDTSASAGGSGVIPFMSEFYDQIRSDPFLRDISHISIIPFGSNVYHSPLVPAPYFVWPIFMFGGLTPLGAALDLLNKSLERDVVRSQPGKGDYRPAVFLFLASRPTDSWRPQAQRLKSYPRGCNIIGIPFGSDHAIKEVLRKIGQIVESPGAASLASSIHLLDDELF